MPLFTWPLQNRERAFTRAALEFQRRTRLTIGLAVLRDRCAGVSIAEVWAVYRDVEGSVEGSKGARPHGTVDVSLQKRKRHRLGRIAMGEENNRGNMPGWRKR